MNKNENPGEKSIQHLLGNSVDNQKKVSNPIWNNSKTNQQSMGGVVTGGGDDLGQEFQANAATGLQKLKKYFSKEEWSAITTALEKARFLIVEESQFVELAGVNQDSVAVNDPNLGIIKISRHRFEQIKSNLEKESIAAHEVLSLVLLESTGKYSYSHKLLIELNSNDLEDQSDSKITNCTYWLNEMSDVTRKYIEVLNSCREIKGQSEYGNLYTQYAKVARLFVATYSLAAKGCRENCEDTSFCEAKLSGACE